MSINYEEKKTPYKFEQKCMKYFNLYGRNLKYLSLETRKESHAGRCHWCLFSKVRRKITAKYICSTLSGKKWVLHQWFQGAYGRKMWGVSLSHVYSFNSIAQYLPQHSLLAWQNDLQLSAEASPWVPNKAHGFSTGTNSCLSSCPYSRKQQFSSAFTQTRPVSTLRVGPTTFRSHKPSFVLSDWWSHWLSAASSSLWVLL